MDGENRAIIAFLAGRHIFGKNAHRVYDVMADVHCDCASLMDKRGFRLMESCTHGDRAGSEMEQSYHYSAPDGPLFMNINGGSFKVYDSSRSRMFAGLASGNLVVLYDRRAKSFFKFRICSDNLSGPGPMICGQVCDDCASGKIKSEGEFSVNHSPCD
jgi:hypothetical protein